MGNKSCITGKRIKKSEDSWADLLIDAYIKLPEAAAEYRIANSVHE